MTLYRHNTDHCRADADFVALKDGLARLKSRADPQAAAILAVPARRDDLEEILAHAARIRKRFSRIVVVGAGGSSLSGKALTPLADGAFPLRFLETIDPDAIAELLTGDMKTTGVIIISKSGETAETLAQFYALKAHAAAEQFTVITGAHDSTLRRAAMAEGISVLDHDAGIGGRFSMLTNVGLLPAALAGLDIAALRAGAQSIVDALDVATAPEDFAPAAGAALHVALGRGIDVMMPYGERLRGLASWWRQSWAESLGKNGTGSTPVVAMGTTDQHSQLQLYLDGPKDKWFHLLLLKRAGTGQTIAASVDYLKGKTTGDLMAAEQKATLETLVRRGCPVRVFEMERFAEKEMGALFMHFTLEIILVAGLLGVNAFDQPAVEDGKKLARDYLRAGNL